MRRLVSALAVLAFCATAPTALAETSLLDTSAGGTRAKLRKCHDAVLPEGPGVRSWQVEAADTGLLRAVTSGPASGSDWDIAVFGAGGRFVAAAASPDNSELAEGFTLAGERLTIQACLTRGAGSRVAVDAATFALPRSSTRRVQILSVVTPTQADRNRLMAMGFDDSHSHGPRTLDIVVSRPEDYERLAAAGFTWTVAQEDLVAQDAERARRDREYAERTQKNAFPSGRTEYRHLADYEAEMKMLAEKHPGTVKLITLPHKSLEGRDILGLEIAQDVNADDGKPVFLQLGVHHAREWPSAEHTMEWAYELINGYDKNARVTRLVNATRNIVVPLVNPDGFNLSREEPVDAAPAAGGVVLPPEVDEQLPISDPAYTAVILADQNAGRFAYKRRNCRLQDGATPAPGECASADNRLLGTDPNRNYGGFWGGPGASLDTESDTYRGAGPFSEPETQNVQKLVSTRHVTTLITNHTFSNLVLRPPGIKSEGKTPDEEPYKALGDAMAAQNGYASQHGYQLYDTTGTTEDWSYYATGGYGFTFEIGPNRFHPPFEEAVAEYDGHGQYAGKGNREAYFLALENTADSKQHSVLKGRAPVGTTLRLHKEFMSSTSPVIVDESGKTERPRLFKDVLDTTLRVNTGRFEWHVNPSTRPFKQKDRRFSGVAEKPSFEEDISTSTPTPPGLNREIEFEVKPDAARQVQASITGSVPADDYDIYLYQGSVAPENQVASSAGGTADEAISFGFPVPGKYVLEIVNFAAVGPYDGKIEIYGEQPGTVEVTKASKETWTLTCERGGEVVGTRKVQVDRGQVKDLGDACANAIGAKGALKLRVKVKRVTRRGVLLALARCSARCTLTASVKGGKRTLARTRKPVRFRGRKAIRLRLSKRLPRRAKLVVVARDRRGNVRSRTVRLRVRRR